ncbi:hypothetical protein [Streptomyces sp. NPDC007346]|uniref:hypothetical protein n=1 Tax=Streptomyces sp. NPDC007346 TaxID=3154682 RepID=UPI0034536A88
MDTQQNTALLRAVAELPGPLPDRGVVHVVIPHTDRFTVVGNHLAQHPGLSTTAVGIAVRIQSLPQGAQIGIKALAARFPEGEKLIATALRELEAHGYLQRARQRLPDGRIVTRTVFCNQPAALLHPRTTIPPQLPPAARETLAPMPVPVADAVKVQELAPQPLPVRTPEPPVPQATAPTTAPEQAAPQAPAPADVPVPTDVPVPGPAPVPHRHAPQDHPLIAPEPPFAPTPPFVPLVPPPTAPKPPRPPLPQPHDLTPELARAATALLSDLRRHAPQFTLSEHDIHHLTPAVATWLERDTHPDTIRHTLTNDPPQPLHHPAKLLKHRLTTLLPPPLPGPQELTAPTHPRTTATPFQTCDGCERAFRSPTPGHCRDCRTTHQRQNQHQNQQQHQQHQQAAA